MLALTDVAVVVMAVYGAHFLRFGFRDEPLTVGDTIVELEIGYLITSTLFVVGWLLALQIFGTRDAEVIGGGSSEYRRIADATLRVFGALAILALLFQVQFGRFYLLIALPSGLILLIASRWLWRQWLNRQRRNGRFMQRAIVIGDRDKAGHIAAQIMREPESGIHIVGAVTTHGSPDPLLNRIPVLGDFSDVLEIIDSHSVDAVILSTADAITPKHTRKFGWALDQKRIDLIVAPALTDIAGPRIHTRPVAG
ncbi:MAG: sugar transferase, partial [Actinomycetota bacterium]